MASSACSDEHSWRDEILAGINHLPNVGPGIGTFAIQDGFHHLVQPILQSESGEIIAVAGQLGDGRVVVLGHIDYAQKFKQGSDDPELRTFQTNVKTWASGGKCQDMVKEVVNAKNMDKRSDYKLLFWKGGPIEGEQQEKMFEYVSDGGGLVFALSPGEWLNSHKKKEMQDIPFAKMLESMGISFKKYTLMHENEDGFYIGCERAKHDTHTDENTEAGKTREPEGWDSYLKKAVTWRLEILDGISSIEKQGVPGFCIAFESAAVPIVTGDAAQNVIMAASELYNGRLFMICHGAYVNKRKEEKFERLMTNIYKWLSKGTYRNEDDIQVIQGKNADVPTDPSSKKILIWKLSHENKSAEGKLVEFLKNGGGVIQAATPWGWLQVNKGKSLKDMALVDIMTQSGLTYTKGTVTCANSFNIDLKESVSENVAMENIGYLLSYCTTMTDLDKYGERIVQGLHKLPANIKVQLADDVKSLFHKFKDQMKYPCSKKPLTNPAQRTLTMLCDFLCNLGQCDPICIPCVETFPGSCSQGEAQPELICVEREFHTDRQGYHSTGVYTLAGVTVKVKVMNFEEVHDKHWVIRIGSHKDDLTHKDHWKRWPKIIKSQEIKEETFEIVSPYGGLLYFENPDFKNKYHTLKVRLEGIIEAPLFDLSLDDAKEKWLACRDSPAPWADMKGKKITITLPADSVRCIEDPSDIMEAWDEVVEAHYNLQSSHPDTHRHQWVVADEQPVAGYMHAGYPIVTHMDVSKPTADGFLLDLQKLKTTGRWGMFHELGHNMQRRVWTFKGTGEVTCNIFTLHAMEVISSQKPWIHSWLDKQMPKINQTLQSDDPYKMWCQNPGVALGIYAQLQHCFGWDAYKIVFSHYENLQENKKPKSDNDRIDYWVKIFSKTVGYNLCPLYDFWAIPVGDKAREEVKDLPSFLPEDEMTALAPGRVKQVEEKYSNIVRSI